MKYDKLVYVHIPKTGGNTVTNLLRRVYRGKVPMLRESSDMHNDNNVMSATWSKKHKIKHIYKHGHVPEARIVMGHFKVTKYQHLGYPTITWLRDPVERVISNYVQQTTKWGRARSKAPTYYRMVSDHQLETYAKVWDSLQTWYCDGSLDNFMFVGILERFEESIEKLGKILEVDFPPVPVKNPTKNKPKFSDEIKKSLRKYQKRDYELYNEAMRRLDKC
jgi:hypothetical protein